MSSTKPIRPPLPILAVTLFLWLVYAAVEVALGLTANAAALGISSLSIGHKVALIATDLTIGFVVLLAVCGAGMGGLRAGKRRWLIRLPVIAMLLGLLFLYGGSWVSFLMTSQFVDIGGLAMWAQSAWQFTQHIAHMSLTHLFAPPVAVLALGVGGPWLLRTLHSSISERARRRFVGAALLPVAAAGALAVWGHVNYAESNTPMRVNVRFLPQSEGPIYRYYRADRVGPVTRFVADVLGRVFPAQEKLERDPELRVLRKPQIAIEEWTAKIDRAQMKRWNVIVLIVESLREDQIVATGGTTEVMPTVERLAQEAVIPAHCYAQASHSDYSDLCPLSSHYPLRGPKKQLYPENPTYPRVLIYDLLKALGWRTAIFSSQNENWGRMLNYLSTGNIDKLLHSETYDGDTYVRREDKGFANWMKGSKRAGKIDDRFTVREATQWIDGLAEDDRFCMYMNLQNSHAPYEVPADAPRRFGPDPADLGFKLTFANYPPAGAEKVKAIYSNSLAYVDDQIGHLVDSLQKSGRLDDTLIVVTGDTGQAFYEHGFAAHGTHLFNEVMRVPLVIRVPGQKQRILQRTAEHVDVLPTVLSLLNLPPHPSCQGFDLTSDDFPEPRTAYLVVQNVGIEEYAIVRGRYKLIMYPYWSHEMLFDLSKDPGEKDDLSERRPKILAGLRRRLSTWRLEQEAYYGDVGRHQKEYPPVLLDPQK